MSTRHTIFTSPEGRDAYPSRYAYFIQPGALTHYFMVQVQEHLERWVKTGDFVLDEYVTIDWWEGPGWSAKTKEKVSLHAPIRDFLRLMGFKPKDSEESG